METHKGRSKYSTTHLQQGKQHIAYGGIIWPFISEFKPQQWKKIRMIETVLCKK